MKRKIAVTALLLMVILCFTGCMTMEDHMVIHEDGTGTVVSRAEFEKDAVDQFAESLQLSAEDLLLGTAEGSGQIRVAYMEGKKYYVLEEEKTFGDFEALKAAMEGNGYGDVFVSESGIRYLLSAGLSETELKTVESAGMNLDDSVQIRIRITMPKEIVMTTGTLSEDKMTAEFILNGQDLYGTRDIVVSTEAETDKPVFSGAKSNKTYNSARTITAKDESGIQKLEYKYKPADGKYGEYQEYSGEKTFTKNGTYRVRATDFYGNQGVKTFTIKDTKRPAVQLDGTMNKKQTYYKESCLVTVSDNCGVKSVKYYVDGKRVKMNLSEILKNGIEADKDGTHKVVVTDVNGNSRTVSFKVK